MSQYLTPCHLLRAPSSSADFTSLRGLFGSPASSAKEADWTSEPGSFSTEKISSIPKDFHPSEEKKASHPVPAAATRVDIASLLLSAKKETIVSSSEVSRKSVSTINDDLPDFLISPAKIASSSILDMIQPSVSTSIPAPAPAVAPVADVGKKASTDPNLETDLLKSESKKKEKKALENFIED